MEEVLTTRPQPRSRIPGSTAWLTRNAPLRLTSITKSHCSSVILAAMASRFTPALLISTSTRPHVSLTRLTRASTPAFRATSPGTASAPAPSSLATRSHPAASASLTATRPPSPSKRICPLPDPLPPVEGEGVSGSPSHEHRLLPLRHRLPPLVLDGHVQHHHAPVGLRGLLQLAHGHLRVDGVAEFHRAGEAQPVHPQQGQRRALEGAGQILLAGGDRHGQH